MEVRGLVKRFGEKALFEGLSLSFPEGRVSCLSGPSGSGKTTLLRLLMGLETPDAGTILCPRPVSCVFQEDRLVEALGAAGNLRLVCGRGRDGEIAALLTALGLDPASREPVARWSGGMKRRVAIARALAVPFAALLLDEPFAGLDLENTQRAAQVILDMSKGKTVLLVTHEPAQAALMGAQIFSLPG